MMEKFLIWYSILYIIELILLILFVYKKADKITIGDAVCILLAPMPILVLPIALLVILFEKVENIIIWRK